MNNLKKKSLKGEYCGFMRKRGQLEGLQTQRNDRLECVRRIEREMQALDEAADRICWILENDL